MKKHAEKLLILTVIGLSTWTLKEVVSLKVQVAELAVKVSALQHNPQIAKIP